MTTTENLGLSVYDASSGSAVTFQNYRLAVAGLTSNMTIIDSFAGAVSGSFLSLQSSSFNNVNATQTSSNYYSAIVSTITSYLTNMVLNLKVDAANTGASVININSLGNIGLKKVSSTGSVQELSTGDLVANKYYLFTYNGSVFIKIADQITVSAVQNNFISAGSAGVLQDSGVPKMTGVTSGSFYRVYVNQYGQVTSGSSTAPSGGHVIVDNSGSLPQRNYLKFTGTGVSVADTGGSSVVTITAGSGGGTSFWRSDSPPASPSSYDDEFSGSSLDSGKWTIVEPTYFSTTFDERGVFMHNDSVLSSHICGFVQPLPSGSFIAWTKVVPVANAGNEVKAFMFLSDGTGSGNNYYTLAVTENSGNMLVQSESWTSTSDLNTTDLNESRNWMGTADYIRFRWDEANYYLDYSTDGQSWIGQRESTLSFTPTHIGVGQKNNFSDVEFGSIFRFFRVIEGTYAPSTLMPGNYT